jgi:hypothetical protein
VEYISPLDSPKNLLILAKKTRPADEAARTEYYGLLGKAWDLPRHRTGVRGAAAPCLSIFRFWVRFGVRPPVFNEEREFCADRMRHEAPAHSASWADKREMIPGRNAKNGPPGVYAI